MELREFFVQHKSAAVAFSGGVDSSYLLSAAHRYGAEVCAYYVKTAFQPEFELRDAKRLASQIGVPLKILEADVLCDERVVSNPADRCYFCKRLIFEKILAEAGKDGFRVVLDGTNASDDEGDRPGMLALRELSVLSPLRLCGLSKSDIRRLSREAGLFTWDKPAYACLATRIPQGERITAEKLKRTERAEDFLFSLGFTDFRVRTLGDGAKLQLPQEQFEKAVSLRSEILGELKKEYAFVLLDLEGR